MGKYDVIIVGGGPAGLFAAYSLSSEGKKIMLFDEGKLVKDRYCPQIKTGKCMGCEPCSIMCGLGGSGLFSDGTLNLRYDIGGDLSEITGDVESAKKWVDEVDKIYLENGAPEKIYGEDDETALELEKKAAGEDIKFIRIRQRHIGTENTPKLIQCMVDRIKKQGGMLSPATFVEDVILEDGVCTGVMTNKGDFKAEKTLLAPGRVGANWVDKIVRKHEIDYEFGAIDVGVRVEVPSRVMDDVISVNHDPKFHIRTETYDDFVRTFCTNYEGWVVKESYDGLIGVNGHSKVSEKSGNTNFAFLVHLSLTEPVEDTIEYGRAIGKLATTIGGGKPIIQRLLDLKKGRRSHMNHILDNPFTNTLKDVTPGDISMALPHRIVTDVIEGLEKLNHVVPGVYSDSTLLYAPEIKFYSMKVKVDDRMQTSIPNLYAAGDGVGLSRDIVNASATGLIAAQGMMREDEC